MLLILSMEIRRKPARSCRAQAVAALVISLGSISLSAQASDPRIDSWFTQASGQYGRVFLTDGDRLAGRAVSTWSRGAISQTLPAYCGVYEVSSSPTWIYVRTTGLGSHVMGPWYGNAAHTALFMNLPKSSATLYRFPLLPTVPASKTLTGLGPIGVFVDGVIQFDSRDAFSVTAVGGTEGNPGLGIWNRDAFVNEGVTFDPANAHQPGSGQYHYHANAIALRHRLGDHVNFDPVTKLYSEAPGSVPPSHSPILGWVRDGFPVYGPYAFANPTNAASGVRRMVSGFVPRDVSISAVANRTTLPAWAARAQSRVSTTLTAAQAGPAVSTARPFGRYLEDNDYLGDLGRKQGADFDLDEHNGRFCVTPEFPNGTYAYFTSLHSDGTPAFPYNVGRQYYGNPTGGVIPGGNYSETVSTNFVGGANSTLRMESPVVSADDGTVTLTWSSVEGGSYSVTAGDTLKEGLLASVAVHTATNSTSRVSEPTVGAKPATRFYRVSRSSIAPYAN